MPALTFTSTVVGPMPMETGTPVHLLTGACGPDD